MVANLILSVLVSVPSPSPSSLPVIERTKTSVTCTALRSFVLPIGYVARRNDDAFRAMARSMQVFLSGIYPGDVPTSAEMAGSLHGAPAGAQADGMGSENEDDQLLFGPGQTLTAARIDAVANQIYANLQLEDRIMSESWHGYPERADPKIDALRQRLQNLMDLQRALADRYERFAWLYLSNQGMASLTDAKHRAPFKAFLRALLLGESAALVDGPAQSENDGYSSVRQRAREGNVAQIVRDLRDQEHAFAPDVLAAAGACNGTHYVFHPAAPLTPQ